MEKKKFNEKEISYLKKFGYNTSFGDWESDETYKTMSNRFQSSFTGADAMGALTLTKCTANHCALKAVKMLSAKDKEIEELKAKLAATV